MATDNCGCPICNCTRNCSCDCCCGDTEGELAEEAKNSDSDDEQGN